MKLNNIGNVLLKIFACVFTIVSLYLLFINITSNYGRLFPMNKLIVVLGAIIILAILLISLGIMIFNQAQDTVTNSGMTEAELTSFNNKFVKYEGKQKGTMVKSMMQEVKSNNANSSDGHDIIVKVKATASGSATETTDTKDIDTKHTYTVSMVYDSTTNRITEINVEY